MRTVGSFVTKMHYGSTHGGQGINHDYIKRQLDKLCYYKKLLYLNMER